MIPRAFIQVDGPPGAGKTALAERLMVAVDGRVLAVRPRGEESLPSTREWVGEGSRRCTAATRQVGCAVGPAGYGAALASRPGAPPLDLPHHRGRPPVTAQLRELVVRRAREIQPGLLEVHGELCRLGNRIGASTAWTIPHRVGVDPTPRRSAPFLAAAPARPANSVLAVDPLTVDAVLLRRL
jgi:hypothetical protein